MGHCDYWWVAGHVEWCDLANSSCKCGGWEESCMLKKHKRRNNQKTSKQMMEELPFEPRQKVTRQTRRAS